MGSSPISSKIMCVCVCASCHGADRHHHQLEHRGRPPFVCRPGAAWAMQLVAAATVAGSFGSWPRPSWKGTWAAASCAQSCLLGGELLAAPCTVSPAAQLATDTAMTDVVCVALQCACVEHSQPAARVA